MNENIDLTKILKDCPKGFEFYSSVHGKLFYDGMYIDSSASRIYFKHSNIHSIADGSPIPIIYLRDGKLYCGEGECTIFPSKDQRDWGKFNAPWYKKEKFDPKTLKPFDKVLVKIGNNGYKWSCDLFSYINNDTCRYHGVGYCAKYCIPYNDDTKHLLGTTDEAPEYYRYWED